MNINGLKKMNETQLKGLWEEVEKMKMTEELPTVRGWIMDAMYEVMGEEATDTYLGLNEEY